MLIIRFTVEDFYVEDYELMFLFGGPPPEWLAPIYSEFMRWKGLINQEFQSHLAHLKLAF